MELKGLYNKGWISNFIESGLKEWGQIMYYMGCCREAFLWMGSGFTLSRCFSVLHHMNYTNTRSFPCSFHTKQKTPLCLTFFFGRCTSSFIEAHLFKVLSRLKERQKKAMGWNCSKQRTHQTRALQIWGMSWIFILPGCKTRPREKCCLSVAQLTKPADTGNWKLLPYHFVRSGFQGPGA